MWPLAYFLVGQATTPDAVTAAAPWLTLVNLGVAGLILYMFLRGKLHSDAELVEARRQRDEAVARADAADAKLVEANSFIRTEVLQALSSSTVALAKRASR